MRTALTPLINLLATSKEFFMVEVYTLTLIDDTPYYYTSIDVDIPYNGNIFLSRQLRFKRNNLKFSKGIEVVELELEIYPSPYGDVLIGGIPFKSACRTGILDGATIKLERLFYNSFDYFILNQTPTPVGALTWFLGNVSDIDPIGRSKVGMKVKSNTERFNVPWPRNLYEPSCPRQLYSAECGVIRDDSKVSGIIAAGSTNLILLTDLTQNDIYFSLGTMTFTGSGANSGVRKTIKTSLTAGGELDLVYPCTYVPAAGDTFDIWPGCDKLMQTCIDKFNKKTNFRGFPYVPVPETIA